MYKRVCVPLANMGRISGLPQHQVRLLWLNTESNSTGFSFHPKQTHEYIKPKLQPNISKKMSCSIGHTPTFSNGTNILVKTCDESNMTRTRLSGNPCV